MLCWTDVQRLQSIKAHQGLAKRVVRKEVREWAAAGESKADNVDVLRQIARDKPKRAAARTRTANATEPEKKQRASKQKQAKARPSAIATAKARERLPTTCRVRQSWKKNNKETVQQTGKQYYLDNKAAFKAYTAKRANEDPVWISTLKRIINACSDYKRHHPHKSSKTLAKYKPSKTATPLERYKVL